MFHGIAEEYKVHHGVGVVVIGESVVQENLQRFPVINRVVLLLIQAMSEVGENERLGVARFVIVLDVGDGEELLRDPLNTLVVGIEVGLANEAVSVHTL